MVLRARLGHLGRVRSRWRFSFGRDTCSRHFDTDKTSMRSAHRSICTKQRNDSEHTRRALETLCEWTRAARWIMMVLEKEKVGISPGTKCSANNNAQWQWPMPRNIRKRRGCSIMHTGDPSAQCRSREGCVTRRLPRRRCSTMVHFDRSCAPGHEYDADAPCLTMVNAHRPFYYAIMYDPASVAQALSSSLASCTCASSSSASAVS